MFLRKLFGGKTTDSDTPSGSTDGLSLTNPNVASSGGREKRKHDRWHILSSSFSRLEFGSDPNGQRLDLHNISYGGIACVDGPAAESVAHGQPFGAKLVIATRHINMRLTSVYRRHGIVAFRILHETPDTLVSMRDLIESMRAGASLAPVQKVNVADRYKSDDWTCLHGEEKIALVFRTVANGDIVEALMTFKGDGEVYTEVALRNGRISTSQSVVTSGVAPQMNVSSGVDRLTIERACFILLAMQPTATSVSMRPFIAMLLKELGFKPPT